MEVLKGMLAIMVTVAITDNYVLSKFLGICPFLGVSKKFDQAVGMSCAVIFVMLLATAVTWPIQYYVLDANGFGYMQTVVFILVIASLVQLVEIILKKYIPALHASLGVYLPLITTNCAVLGVTINNISDGYNFAESLVCSFGAGLGFMIAMILFSGVRSRIEGCEAPACFQGLPIILAAAAIMSMSFFGFSGVVGNLFG